MSSFRWKYAVDRIAQLGYGVFISNQVFTLTQYLVAQICLLTRNEHKLLQRLTLVPVSVVRTEKQAAPHSTSLSTRTVAHRGDGVFRVITVGWLERFVYAHTSTLFHLKSMRFVGSLLLPTVFPNVDRIQLANMSYVFYISCDGYLDFLRKGHQLLLARLT